MCRWKRLKRFANILQGFDCFCKIADTRAWSGWGCETAGWESEGWKFPSEISIQARAGVAGGAKVGAKTQVAFFNA